MLVRVMASVGQVGGAVVIWLGNGAYVPVYTVTVLAGNVPLDGDGLLAHAAGERVTVAAVGLTRLTEVHVPLFVTTDG